MTTTPAGTILHPMPASQPLSLNLTTASRWRCTSLPELTLAEAYVLAQAGHIEAVTFSLDEVGVLLGVSRERVRQVEQKALSRLAARQELADLWRAPDPA